MWLYLPGVEAHVLRLAIAATGPDHGPAHAERVAGLEVPPVVANVTSEMDKDDVVEPSWPDRRNRARPVGTGMLSNSKQCGAGEHESSEPSTDHLGRSYSRVLARVFVL
jgi:hypothetical protein